MMWLLDLAIGTRLGRFVTGALTIVLAIIGFRFWLTAHDASTRHGALAGYVKQVELDTAKAKLAETERQLAAGRAAAEEYAQRLAEAEAKERADDAETERRTADYEKQLAAKGRSCRLNGDDLKFLRHS
jgi:uncharacterized protein YlxW (UPF0749 family)